MPDQYETVADAKIGILMGSASDWPTMQAAAKTLRDLEIPYEANVISAHRAPRRLEHYCGSAEERGIRALICAAGGAAHLAGVAAALTPIPVLACPMKAWSLEGLDSLLSMAQMPKGIPVATFAIGSAGATNAALFAVAMLAGTDEAIDARYRAVRKAQSDKTFPLPPIEAEAPFLLKFGGQSPFTLLQSLTRLCCCVA